MLTSFVKNHKNEGIEGGKCFNGCPKTLQTNSPLISIITATYNSVKFLPKAIQSIRDQTYKNVEWIVIDGASNDGTVDILKQNGDVIDYWLSETDNGIYDALNKGLGLSTGDWIYVLGSDDVLYPNALEQVASYLEEQSIIYYGNVRMLSDGSIFDGPFNSYKIMYYNISHQSIFYPKNIFKNNLYNTKYKGAADFEFLLRSFGNRNYRLKYIPVIVAEYNDIDGISSKKEDPIFLKDHKEIIKCNFPLYLYILYSFRYYIVFILKILKIKNIMKTHLNKLSEIFFK